MKKAGFREEEDANHPGARAGSLADCSRLWGVKDVAAFLGVPVGTLYQWRTRGAGPPAMRMGRHLRFDPAAVRTWASQQVVR